MPELPEVETARRLAARILAGRRIVAVAAADDGIVYDGAAPARVAAALRGRRVVGVRRRGKYFWLELDRRPWPLLHLGMTGRIAGWTGSCGRDLRVPTGAAVAGRSPLPQHEGRRIITRGRAFRNADPVRFLKLDLRTDDGGRLVMTDARRLGRIRLRRDPAAEPPVSRLGPDPLVDGLTAAYVRDVLARRTPPIKAVLLDQSVFAGVGNWIADEVLYQARIAPARRARGLRPEEAERLRKKLLAVIGHAVKVGADDGRFPRSWLFHYRWGRGKAAAVPGAGRIAFRTIGGRTAVWVPVVQR